MNKGSNTIGIDIDATLLISGKPNLSLIEWIKKKKQEGYSLMLWSMQGKEYAERVAMELEIVELFDTICSKPRYIVDDCGWKWTQYTRVVTPKL